MLMTGLARIGRDAELRYATSGDAVCSLSLAFNYGQKGADNRRPTQWVEAALWGKRAEALSQYLLSGGLVCVTLSEPHIETFDRRDGSPGHKLVARVLEIELAGSAPSAGEGSTSSRPASPAPARAGSSYADAKSGRAPAPATQRPAAQAASGSSFDDMEDDIPF